VEEPPVDNAAIESCVARARSGDARAFTELIGQCERIVLATAFAVLNDAHLAGDVAQETFLRAWRRLNELQRPAAFEAWVCGIARNLAADYARKRAAVRAMHETLPVKDVGGLEIAFHAGERRQRIAAALAQLDELTRGVVVLRYYENLPSKRIGELLSLSAAAVDMRLSRGRQQLRQSLSDWADEAARVASEVSS
jgi:RNA polymerase sigma factor (sigma-70 family)